MNKISLYAKKIIKKIIILLKAFNAGLQNSM